MSYIPSSRVSVFSISSSCSRHPIEIHDYSNAQTNVHTNTFCHTKFLSLSSKFCSLSSLEFSASTHPSLSSRMMVGALPPSSLSSLNQPPLYPKMIFGISVDGRYWNGIIILSALARMDGVFVYWYSYLSRFCWIQILGSREMGIISTCRGSCVEWSSIDLI